VSRARTVPRALARGVVDPDTGAILALSGWSVIRLTDGRLDELTPDHEWPVVAAGGGAVAMAGGGFLTWTDGRNTRRLSADGLHRVAVHGATVAGATEDGAITVWSELDGSNPPEPVRTSFAGAPDGVALAPGLDRLAVWGWLESGHAELAVFTLHPPTLVRLRDRHWPEPAAGVAFPVAGQAIAIATTGQLVVLDPDGNALAEHPAPGVERVAGRGTTLAWMRSTRRRVAPLVGVGQLTGRGLRDVVEQPFPGADRFPELAVVGNAAVLVAGVAADQLAVHRLGRDGWAPPRRHTLPPAAPPG
jgi:hypothetical protein